MGIEESVLRARLNGGEEEENEGGLEGGWGE